MGLNDCNKEWAVRLMANVVELGQVCKTRQQTKAKEASVNILIQLFNKDLPVSKGEVARLLKTFLGMDQAEEEDDEDQ